MLQSYLAIIIQNGRPEMFEGSYLSRYSTDNDFFSVYYRSKDKESKSDILHKYGIQLGGSNLRWMPTHYNVIWFLIPHYPLCSLKPKIAIDKNLKLKTNCTIAPIPLTFIKLQLSLNITVVCCEPSESFVCYKVYNSSEWLICFSSWLQILCDWAGNNFA